MVEARGCGGRVAAVWWASVLLLVVLLGPGSGAAQEAQGASLDDRIERLRTEWRVPGLAVAIVVGDSVVLARGYGERGAEAGAVDEATLFAIGSTTKAFTSTALAMLVAKGVLGWDDPVTAHLPSFALGDAWVTREITLRDLLAHRSGLPMANVMWLTGQLDAEELIARLRHLQPSGGFRSGLSYQNVLYLVAGRILEERAGLSWERFLAERILAPLGMRRTRPGVAGLERVENVATPHILETGGARPVPYRDIDVVGPAGSLMSSAADMARWLRFQLAGGELDGRRLVSRDALLETRRPQIVMRPEGPLSVFYPEARTLSYGMGWVISEYRGLALVDHGGGIDGMTTLVALVPERELGIAILTNAQLSTPPYWLLYPLLDHLLGRVPVDRSAVFQALSDQVRRAVTSTSVRAENAPPSRSLAAYGGEYASPVVGPARVVVGEGALHLELGRLSAPLEPWHFDTFRLQWTDRAWLSAAGPGWLTFRLDTSGDVQAFEFSAVPGESWTFTRSPRSTGTRGEQPSG